MRGVTWSESFAVRVPFPSSLASSTLRTVAFAGRPKRWSSVRASGLSQPVASQTMSTPGAASEASMSRPKASAPAAIEPASIAAPRAIISQPAQISVRIGNP